MIARTRLAWLLALLVPACTHASSSPIVEFAEPVEISTGASILSAGERIGEVTEVRTLDSGATEVVIRLDETRDDEVRMESIFLVTRKDGSTVLEHYPPPVPGEPAKEGARLSGAGSVSEVWARQGRIATETWSREIEGLLRRIPRELETLRESEDWKRLKKDLVRTSAELATRSQEVSEELVAEMRRLEKELAKLYEEYADEAAEAAKAAKPLKPQNDTPETGESPGTSRSP